MRIRKFPVYDAVHLLELFHQVLFVVEAPCRITDQYIRLPRLCSVDGIIYHGRRIRAVCAADHINARAVRPLRELIPCRGAERICRGDQHFLSLPLQDTCKLADRRGLSDAVDADHKYDRLLLLKVIRRLAHRHLFLDALDQQFLALRRMAEMTLLHFVLHALNDIIRRVDTDIPHDQDLLKLLVEVIIDLRCTVKHRVDPRYDIVSCLI